MVQLLVQPLKLLHMNIVARVPDTVQLARTVSHATKTVTSGSLLHLNSLTGLQSVEDGWEVRFPNPLAPDLSNHYSSNMHFITGQASKKPFDLFFLHLSHVFWHDDRLHIILHNLLSALETHHLDDSYPFQRYPWRGPLHFSRLVFLWDLKRSSILRKGYWIVSRKDLPAKLKHPSAHIFA